MNICVILCEPIRLFPPAMNVVTSLLRKEHQVTLVAYDVDGLSHLWSHYQSSLTINELGKRAGTLAGKLRQNIRMRRYLRSYLQHNTGNFDYVWTMTDLTARECGTVLLRHRHIMFLAELVESVPAMSNRIFGDRRVVVKDSVVPMLARRAWKVVVPERNRAHIQRVLWDLKIVPTVIPNKPLNLDEAEDLAGQSVRHNKRPIGSSWVLVYQGIFAPDRNIDNYAAAVESLGERYTLNLVGNFARREDRTHVMKLCASHERTCYKGYVPAPEHLAYTARAHIGLLPYRPTKNARFSPLNALYCAPNKVWEYSAFGLPMIGSDVPGLFETLELQHAGLTVNDSDVNSIIGAIETICNSYERYSAASRSLFDTVCVEDLIDGVMQ